MRPLLVTSCALLLINLANGYPSGAPGSACSSLVPRHPGGSVQASYPPYQVLAAAGQGRIRLTLGSPQGLPYEGFILVARDTQTGEYVGEFANLPEGAQYLECTPGLRNAVTHTDKQKKQNLEFEWEAPNEYEGTIIFNSTFLQDYETYWVGIESPRITVLRGSIEVMSTTPLPGGNGFSVSNPATPSYFDQERIGQRPVAEDSKDDVFYDGCGETKNCLGSSPGCLRSKDCIAVVSVLVRGEEYIFELMTQQGKWVGVGLSNDSKMKKVTWGHTIGCDVLVSAFRPSTDSSSARTRTLSPLCSELTPPTVLPLSRKLRPVNRRIVRRILQKYK